jgi:uncharacterized repeat protein (TIGR01451 family)
VSDGRDVKTSYTGAAKLQQVLEQNLARPLALASADFDEDGVPDLISGYAGSSGGIITLHRGNIDSIYPNAPEAQQRKVNGTYTDSPFLSPALVFEVAEAADFVGAGDFDADSHWDVVAAARRGKSLWLLPGDGRGSFGAARRINLPGLVTTLVTGEINRADGLTDVVVGVIATNGPKALVFESPEGALRGEPEAYSLPAEATAMALGRLDDDYTMDLAVGAGSDLILVYGRDRKLSLDEIRQADVPQAKIGRRSLPFAIKSAAIGDFTGDHKTGVSVLSTNGSVHLLTPAATRAKKKKSGASIESWKDEEPTADRWPLATALVCARISSIPVDNLVVVDPANHKLHIVLGSADPRLQASGAQLESLDIEDEPTAVLPMRLNADALNDLVILENGHSAPTMTITQPLATFTVTNTNDDGPGSLAQAILDANANAGLDMINFSIGSGVQTIDVGSVRGTGLPTITDPVIIDGTTQPGYAGSPLIELNGTNAPIMPTGLFIQAAGSSTIRGLVINRFLGNGIGILCCGGNIIEGNYIGTDVSGTADLGNSGIGVAASSSTNNTIGGTAGGARNVISGNNSHGITIGGSTGDLVQGNFIGTDANGTTALGNSGDGVNVQTAANSPNTIGGTAAGARNVISGNNGSGIQLGGSSLTGHLVQGNFIGTDASGTADLGNSLYGVSTGDAGITIGGTAAGARNVISGNNSGGIAIVTTGINLVQGNFIGTDASGTAALGNSGDGVLISGSIFGNTVGGTDVGTGNTIAFNGGNGVAVDLGGGNNAILSNSIHSNIGLGIDLGTDGVTANDACDLDAGANDLQNFPVLISASTTIIEGTLNSRANFPFTIQFFSNTSCDPSGNGEGQTFIGSMTVTTDASCNASFTFPTSLSLGQVVTATATAGNTSEFSQCQIVTSAQQTFVVTNTNESGPGSLRQAIIDAASGDIINFNIPASDPGCTGGVCTITLASELAIDKSLTIQGPGANQLTVSGNNVVRVFSIAAGNFNPNVTLSGLTIANGNGVGSSGGGILNQSTGTLNVINSTLSGNSASSPFGSQGGGISNSATGTLNVTGSTLSGNSAGGSCSDHGGGISNNGGILSITNSTLHGNSAALGAGVSNNGGMVTLMNSTLSGNSSSCASTFGGGIYSNGGMITLMNSTLSCNSATYGGGIYNPSLLNVTNSTISGNSALSQGGGILNDTFGILNVTNSTISGNSSSGSGGGILNQSNFQTQGVVVKTTITAVNTASTSGPDVFGPFTSQGYNLIGKNDGSTGFTNGVNNDQVGTSAAPLDPLLGPLADNGGPTQTQALLAGSPAIDKSSAADDPNTGAPITTDQRGLPRPVDDATIANASGGDGSDIGAFEVQTTADLAELSLTKTDSPDPVIRGNNITYTVILTNNGPSSAANASLSDAVPTNTKFVSNSGTADWSCTNPRTKGTATGTITCVKSSLATGESATFTIVVQVKSGVKEGTIITNTATVSSSTSDPNTSNNSATTTTTVIRR